MTTFADMPLRTLLDAFASPEPTPGGGSAAAIAGALGASLLAMVAGMAKTKTGAPEERAALDRAHGPLLALRQELLDLADRDTAAYNSVVAAYRLPKTTDAEKAARKAAIQDAMREATEAPIETLRACGRAIDAGLSVAQHGNPSAKSDVAVGIQLLGAASTGALMNVEVNLQGISDAALVASLTEHLRAVVGPGRRAHAEAYMSSGIVELMKQAGARAGTMTADGKHVTPE